MQRIERLLGFQVKVSDYLPGVPLTGLGKDFVEAARINGLSPEEYFVYVHNLTIKAGAVEFLKGTKLRERVHSVVIGFFVNEKQQKNKRLMFANHHFRGLIQPDHQYADYNWVQYTLLGSELETLGTFSNRLITFVHQSLPRKHRKIKVAIMARPTELLPLTLRKNITTKLDLRYERFTQFQLLKRRGRSALSTRTTPPEFDQVGLTKTVTFNAKTMVFTSEEVNMSKYEFKDKVLYSAIGDNARFVQNASSMSAQELAAALETVQPTISARAKSQTEQEDARTIDRAIVSAREGDKEGALGHLKKVGSWGWDVVKELSKSITV